MNDTHFRGHEVIIYYPPLVFCRSDVDKNMVIFCNRYLPYFDDNLTSFELVKADTDVYRVYERTDFQLRFIDECEEEGDLPTCITWLSEYYRESAIESFYYRREPALFGTRRHHFFETEFYYVSLDKNMNDLWDLHVEERYTGRIIFQKPDFANYWQAVDYIAGWLWDSDDQFVTQFMMENYIDYLTEKITYKGDWEQFKTLWSVDSNSYFAAREFMEVWRLEYAHPRQPSRLSPVLYSSVQDVVKRIAREIAWHDRAEEFGFNTLWEYLKNENLS